MPCAVLWFAPQPHLGSSLDTRKPGSTNPDRQLQPNPSNYSGVLARVFPLSKCPTSRPHVTPALVPPRHTAQGTSATAQLGTAAPHTTPAHSASTTGLAPHRSSAAQCVWGVGSGRGGVGWHFAALAAGVPGPSAQNRNQRAHCRYGGRWGGGEVGTLVG